MSLLDRLKHAWLRRPKFLGGRGRLHHLGFLSRPKWSLGWGLTNLPAIPIHLTHIPRTLIRLLGRLKELESAVDGLTNRYTIRGETGQGHEFLFGTMAEADAQTALTQSLPEHLHGKVIEEWSATARDGLAKGLTTEAQRRIGEQIRDSHARLGTTRRLIRAAVHEEEDTVKVEDSTDTRPNKLSLDDPAQWTISWTNYDGTFEKSTELGKEWARSFIHVDDANRLFWPTIAQRGLAYNLIILQKVGPSNVAAFKATFDEGWPDELNKAYGSETLFVIDMSIFQHIKPHREGGLNRFTPSTTTYLVQDESTKTLTPIHVRVSQHDGPSTFYSPSDPAWLYALQAAKTSVTVYGIWLGHVYHWHIVTAAMQMTMHNTLPRSHPVYELMKPQSNDLIEFDQILILNWNRIGPPTSITSPRQFFRLLNHFAHGRSFFDDDPKTAVEALGLKEADFTDQKPWDLYPVVQYTLSIWKAAAEFVSVFVDQTYDNDAAVSGDRALRAWIRNSGKRRGGNVQGLPGMTTKQDAKDVLTSLVYRVTAHGNSRMNRSLNPAESFVGNYPPCLQKTDIPSPDTVMTTPELLEYLPKTGTIGKMVNFLYVFIYSKPYTSFIPDGGAREELYFPGGAEAPKNAALIEFRKDIVRFMELYEPGIDTEGTHQWPRNIET